MRKFDKKFGKEFLATLPTTPGIYRIFDANDFLIYIGKAKNLRRRLSQYRNAKRRKKHYKMRSIVADAVRIEIENCASDQEACLLEAKLIQELRPRWNTAGAFYFLYPMVGLKWDQDTLYFCYTTSPEQIPGFEYHGAFRSRGITGGAFFALMELLTYVGHRIPKKRSQNIPKYSHVIGFRQLPKDWLEVWARFFRGESRDALEALVLALVENASARRTPKMIQKSLNLLALFWRHEARSLARVCEAMEFKSYPVPQKERDFLYLKRRFQKTEEARA